MQIDRPIAIAVMIFAIILLVFFLVSPEYNTFTGLETQLGEKQAEYDAEFSYYNAIAATYQNLQSHQDDINKVDDALPTNPDLGKIIYFLQQASTQNGMMIKDLFLSKSSQNIAQSNTGGNIKNIVFSMDVLGNYSSLEQFLISLEQSSRIFEITSISFGSSAPTPAASSQGAAQAPAPSQFQIQQTYSFNLQIKTYSY
jgi:Tfp pilus assembly protein PilO